MNERCLTDEEMTAYVDGLVDASDRERIEAHLAGCPACLHHVAELKELVSSDIASRVPVPEGVLSRAESLITAYTRSPAEFAIVAVLKEGICRILDTTGKLLAPRRPLAVALRGQADKGLNPRIAKSLSGYLVTVELKVKKGDVRPILTLSEEATSTRPDGIKTRLHSPDASETKYTHNGKAEFQALGRGHFRIDIEQVGSIDLEIR